MVVGVIWRGEGRVCADQKAWPLPRALPLPSSPQSQPRPATGAAPPVAHPGWRSHAPASPLWCEGPRGPHCGAACSVGGREGGGEGGRAAWRGRVGAGPTHRGRAGQGRWQGRRGCQGSAWPTCSVCLISALRSLGMSFLQGRRAGRRWEGRRGDGHCLWQMNCAAPVAAPPPMLTTPAPHSRPTARACAQCRGCA